MNQISRNAQLRKRALAQRGYQKARRINKHGKRGSRHTQSSFGRHQ